MATVSRGRYYSINSLDKSKGMWGDIFPDIYETSDEDIIRKFTYENDFGQPLEISDPRYSHSANPDFHESLEYYNHLRRFTYTHDPANPVSSSPYHFLQTATSPIISYPDGTVSGSAVSYIKSYDHGGRVLETEDPEGMITKMSYYKSGELEGFWESTHLDPAQTSIMIRVERDKLGRVVRRYSPKFFEGMSNKFVTEINYNALDQITTLISTPPFRFKTDLFYNRSGNVVIESFERKSASGSLLSEPYLLNKYTYSEELNLLRKVTGGSGNSLRKTYRYIYDIFGRLVLEISPAGRKTRLHYDEISLISKKVSDYGGQYITQKRFYDRDGRVDRIIDATGSTSKFIYDPFGRIIEYEDAVGNKRLLTYDKLGNILVERFFETAGGSFKLVSRIQYYYDEIGRKIRTLVNRFDSPVDVTGDIQDAFVHSGPGESLTTSYFLNKIGDVIKVVDSNKREFITEYDKLKRVVKRVDPYGNEVNLQYDKNGNLIRIDRNEASRNPTDGTLIAYRYFATTFEYDELDRMIAKRDNLGNVINYEYDSMSQLTTIIDPNENRIDTERDIFGRIIKENKYLAYTHGGAISIISRGQYKYDLDDLLLEQLDALGRITKFRYDTAGRLISTILPDNSEDFTVYDMSNRVTVYTDRNGLIRKYQYDPLGRMTDLEIDDSNLFTAMEVGGPKYTKFIYDGIGRVVQAENDYSKYSMSYDSLDFLIKETMTYFTPQNPPVQRQFTIKRTYNSNGSVSKIIYPAGRVINFERDILDRITSIGQEKMGLGYPGDNGIPEYFTILKVQYEGLQRKVISRYNKSSTIFEYDRNSRIIEVNHNYKNGLLSKLQYLYDAAGNIRQKKQQSTEISRTNVYLYDKLYRIIEASESPQISFDNLELFYPTKNPVPSIIPNTQALMSSIISNGLPKKTNYTYDNVGNRLLRSESSVQETYFPNQLDQYDNINSNDLHYDKMGNLSSDNLWKYIYNFNNQIASISDSNGAIKFCYDPFGRKVMEVRQDQIKSLVYDRWNIIEEYDNDGLICSVVSDSDAASATLTSTNNDNYWSYTDLIRSVTHVLRGEEKEYFYDYDEFGRTSIPIQNTNISNQFAGKKIIPELQKYDFPYRIYDPRVGRFVQRDPKGYVEGSNMYLYASNNPVSRTDPFGMESRSESQSLIDLVNPGSDIIGYPLDSLNNKWEEHLKTLQKSANNYRSKWVDAEIRINSAQRRGAEGVLESWIAGQKESLELYKLQANKLQFKDIPKLRLESKLFKVAEVGADAAGVITAFSEKVFGNESPAQTTQFKIVDGLLSGAGDYAIGKKNPAVAAIDAILGIAQKYTLGKEYVSISKTVSGAASNYAVIFEAIATGDPSGLEAQHEKSMAFDNSGPLYILESIGNFNKDNLRGSENAEIVAEAFSGAPSQILAGAAMGPLANIAGGDKIVERAAGFLGSVPQAGHFLRMGVSNPIVEVKRFLPKVYVVK
jgi:RHS repeat-associated protein